jgi:hypothetical protein
VYRLIVCLCVKFDCMPLCVQFDCMSLCVCMSLCRTSTRMKVKTDKACTQFYPLSVLTFVLGLGLRYFGSLTFDLIVCLCVYSLIVCPCVQFDCMSLCTV